MNLGLKGKKALVTGAMAQQMQPAQQQSMFVDVSQLTAAYQLGPALKEYKNTAWTTMVSGIALTVVGGAFMLLSLVLFWYKGFLRLESYLFFFGLALLGYGIARIRAAGRNRGAQVYRCTDGMMRVKAAEVEAIRWDQCTAVQKIFTSVQGISSLTRYILYQPGTIPLVLDKTFDGFEELGAEIEREVTRHLLPGAIAAYEAGYAVSFGPVSATIQGLSVQAGRKTLPWEELGEIYVANRFTTIKKKGALLTWEKLSISTMLNLCVFLPFVKHILEGRKDKQPLSNQPPPNDNPQNPDGQNGYAQAVYPQSYEGGPVPLPYHPLPQPSSTAPSPQLPYGYGTPPQGSYGAFPYQQPGYGPPPVRIAPLPLAEAIRQLPKQYLIIRVKGKQFVEFSGRGKRRGLGRSPTKQESAVVEESTGSHDEQPARATAPGSG